MLEEVAASLAVYRTVIGLPLGRFSIVPTIASLEDGVSSKVTYVCTCGLSIRS